MCVMSYCCLPANSDSPLAPRCMLAILAKNTRTVAHGRLLPFNGCRPCHRPAAAAVPLLMKSSCNCSSRSAASASASQLWRQKTSTFRPRCLGSQHLVQRCRRLLLRLLQHSRPQARQTLSTPRRQVQLLPAGRGCHWQSSPTGLLAPSRLRSQLACLEPQLTLLLDRGVQQPVAAAGRAGAQQQAAALAAMAVAVS